MKLKHASLIAIFVLASSQQRNIFFPYVMHEMWQKPYARLTIGQVQKNQFGEFVEGKRKVGDIDVASKLMRHTLVSFLWVFVKFPRAYVLPVRFACYFFMGFFFSSFTFVILFCCSAMLILLFSSFYPLWLSQHKRGVVSSSLCRQCLTVGHVYEVNICWIGC